MAIQFFIDAKNLKIRFETKVVFPEEMF